ncbi:zf-HC2 domain-containing protein [Longimicrobium sp.]|uniref:zf-HC2 domain-containing protein n=1 Tax=Longimicrobium sp. TaxID=2029185 RepID=UPI003B3AE68A
MMDCGTFLDGYSDFRDGMLALPDRVAFEAHLRDCASCARYDRVVDGGARVLRDLPELEVSGDFMERLQHRIWHEQDDMAAARARLARRSSRRVAAVGMAAAASVAAVAVVPGMYARLTPTVTMLPSAAASAPAPETQYRLAAEHAGEGLAARLEEVGVEVYPMPYGNVLYHAASTAALSSPGDGLRHSTAE